MTPVRILAFYTQDQIGTARRLAVETGLSENEVVAITQNKPALPGLLEQFAHIRLLPEECETA
jgi:hypothetical protein